MMSLSATLTVLISQQYATGGTSPAAVEEVAAQQLPVAPPEAVPEVVEAVVPAATAADTFLTRCC